MYLKKLIENHAKNGKLEIDSICAAVRLKTKNGMYHTIDCCSKSFSQMPNYMEHLNENTGCTWFSVSIVDKDVGKFISGASTLVAEAVNRLQDGFIFCDTHSVLIAKDEIAEIFADFWVR